MHRPPWAHVVASGPGLPRCANPSNKPSRRAMRSRTSATSLRNSRRDWTMSVASPIPSVAPTATTETMIAIVLLSMQIPRMSRAPYLIAGLRQYPLPPCGSSSCRPGYRRLSIPRLACARRTLGGRSGKRLRPSRRLLHATRGKQWRVRTRWLDEGGSARDFASRKRCVLVGCPRHDRGGLTLVHVAHPPALVDGLPRRKNGARPTARYPDAEPPARYCVGLDADSRRSRPSRGDLDPVDPRYPVTVAAHDDAVERHGERRRAMFGLGT